jgi:Cu+-exporting ATPase
MNISLKIGDMDCANCALGIERHLQKLGLKDARVNFGTKELSVSAGAQLGRQQIKGEIERLGYRVFDTAEASDAHQDHEHLASPRKALISCALTLPLVLHMFFSWHWLHNPWLQLALCLPVVLIGFSHFVPSALRSLRAGLPNMDVLIVIGVSAAFFYSALGTFLALGPNFIFFETAATISSLVLLGNFLEQRAVARTTSSLHELAALQATAATRQRADGGLEQVAIEQLAVGDLVLVRQGDKVPVDGKIVSGTAVIDQAMISGEPVPVDKCSGDIVYGGTIVSSGQITIQASALRNQSLLGQMIQLVKEAQSDRPKLQRIGDRVAGYFAPVVSALACATFAISFWALELGLGESLLRSIAVLVVACPCALGLATPTAIMVGIGHAARQGILLKGASTLEELAQVRTIVFDKTGTLTSGVFAIRAIKQYLELPHDLGSVLRGICQRSSHPVAQSVYASVTQAEDTSAPIEFQSVKEHEGLGLLAIDQAGNQYRLGNARFMEIADLPLHRLYLSINQQLAAGIDFSDQVRPDAKQLISALHARGLTCVLLSGDQEANVREVANSLGISSYYAGKLPAEKLEIIKALDRNQPVAYVGDGINDAPALAAASVGISLHQGSAIAINSARVVLLGTQLLALDKALEVAQRTYATMKQNLAWAFMYNIIAIPLAAAGYLSPMLAAFSMGASDLMIVANSLRLRMRRF